ncbi:MAG: restriction endonuclease subunit S [Bacteroidales bacterium]
MKAEELRKSILQLAIQGKLVAQCDDDEPASVLLDKIRAEKAQLIKDKKIKKDKNESVIYRGEDGSWYERVGKEVTCIDEAVPFEIPDSWEWCRLGNIGDWGAGATPLRGKSAYYNNGTIPWLKTGELNNSIVYDTVEKITPLALKECSLRLNKVGDILIAMYGATIGKLAIAGCELTTNQACCACTPFTGIDNKFLFHLLFANKQRLIKQGEGGAQPNISREKIVRFLIALPPLAEQKRIVAKLAELEPLLAEYDGKEKELSEINSKMPEELKKSVLQYAIQGKLVEQDPTDEPAAILLERIRTEKEQLIKEKKIKRDKNDSIIYRGEDGSWYERKGKEVTCIDEAIPFEIPSSWQWCRLIDICNNIHYGYTASAGITGNARLLRITDIQNNTVNWHNVPYCTVTDRDLSTYGLCENDILIARTGGTIGKTYIVQGIDVKSVFASYLIRAIPNVLVFPNFAKLFLETPLYWFQITQQSMGTGQPNVNGEALKQLLLPLPPLAEQKRIVEKLNQILEVL